MIWVGFPTPIFGSTPKSWLMTAIAGGIHQLQRNFIGDFSGVRWIHLGEMDLLLLGLFLCFAEMDSSLGIGIIWVVGPLPGCNRYHQDDIIFLGSGIPN